MRNLYFLIVFSVSGCCALGERSMYFSGEAPEGDICYLSYHDASGETEYRKESVSGNFKSSIMMGGCGGEFVISAVCNEKTIKTFKISSKIVASYDKPYQIGNIAP